MPSNKPPKEHGSRHLALKILVRVAQDRAWACRSLGAALNRTQLLAEDKRLATELVYGTLRHEGYIDFVLQRLLKKPTTKLPSRVHAVLRMGVHQILNLRVPDHAAVGESVALIKGPHPQLAGLVNATLRRVARLKQDQALPDPLQLIEDPLEQIAVMGSHPLWLVRRIAGQLGIEETKTWIKGNNQRPTLTLRINRLTTNRITVMDALTAQGINATAVQHLPDAITVQGQGAVVDLPGFAEGHFSIQDGAAQLVAHMVDFNGMRCIVDSCAAPGGKATHIAERTCDQATIIAIDISPTKINLINTNATRLGLQSIATHVGDAQLCSDVEHILHTHQQTEADVIFLDAPCSGTGTLQRHPELRSQSDRSLDELCALQRKLLSNMARFVRKGGYLVYSVCSVLNEEGIKQVLHLTQTHQDFQLTTPTDTTLAPFLVPHPKGGATLESWPHRHGLDGFFAACLIRH